MSESPSVKTYRKKYRRDNKNKISNLQKRWREENPFRVWASSVNGR